MWRWLFWAARMLATALLLSFLSIWTTGYIVNSYVETILKQLNLPIETKPLALSGVWGKLWGAGGGPQAEEEPERAWERAADRDGGSLPNDERTEGSLSPDPQHSRERSDGTSGRSPAADRSGAGNGDSVDPTGGNDLDSSYPGNTDSSYPDDQTDKSAIDGAVPVFGNEQQSAGLSEGQQQAMRSIMSKLNGGQLSALTSYLADGVTAEERVDIVKLLESSLSETELQQLLEIIDANVEIVE